MKVRNLTKDSLELKSADGDSVLLMSGTLIEIEDKFNWMLDPKKVKVSREENPIQDTAPVIVAQPSVPVSEDVGEQEATLASREAARGNSPSTMKNSNVGRGK